MQTNFSTFKASQGNLIFADDIAGLCDAEKRRIHACSNGRTDAFELSQIVENPAAVAVFEFDHENALEKFADGSLYVKSSGDSEVWAFAGDYFTDVVNQLDSPEAGLRAFFRAEEPQVASQAITDLHLP